MKKVIVLLTLSHFFLSSCNTNTKIDRYKIAKIIESNNLSQFEKLSNKINLDTCKFGQGRNALHYALQMHSNEIANKLIDDDFMLNKKDSLNFTPLLYAIHYGDKKITNKLLAKNVSVNDIEYFNGFSPLHYAVDNNDTLLLQKLLQKKADINIKSESVMGHTPLHLAIEKNNANIVKFLIDKGASDTITDVNNHSVIEVATKSKNIEILELFYDRMNIDNKEKLFINTVRSSGDVKFLNKMLNEKWMTKKMLNDALVFTVDTVTAKALLNKNANIKALHSDYNYGAIHYAAIRGDTIMLDFLIKKGANVNQLAKKQTVSPLMYAAQLNGEAGNLNKKTEKFNINVNVILYDLMGKSLEKNKQNSMASVKFLINNKANVNYKNSDNENALYYADASFNQDVSIYLKEEGIKQTKQFTESKSEKMRRIMNNL